jgi:hypothetical protein
LSGEDIEAAHVHALAGVDDCSTVSKQYNNNTLSKQSSSVGQHDSEESLHMMVCYLA